MTISFPVLPQGSQTTLSLRTAATILSPTLGGPDQRIARMGDRWAVQIVAPSMRADQAQAVVTALLQGLSEKLLVTLDQPGIVVGSPGTPVVSGSGQSGSSLTISGFSSGYQIQNGQMFSILAGGVRYLHRVRADVTAPSGGGAVSVPIMPMLKVSPNNGATCEFAAPKIEGFPSGDEQSWTISKLGAVGLTFRLVEAQ